MQLTLHSDYALRVLLYLAHFPARRCTTAEISKAYGVSKNHLVRVMHTLASHGYVELLPGRSGGVVLARTPREIRIGSVVRDTEVNLNIVECFQPETSTCSITGLCGLNAPLHGARNAFFDELDKYTLADVIRGQSRAKFVEIMNT
ncbi:MAG: Rrf2 family transcriptional regulator [Acidobacteria bacterium]|nr:Rrf2 family transcriptional regulator [Acidobacteriota bacterium]